MAQFKAFAPSVEVNGETISSVVNGIAIEDFATKLLAECGIADVTPGKWYSQQAWLDAFKEIATSIGPNTLFQIGQKIPASANWPTGIDTLEKALESIDVAYHMNHRHGEIGHYRFQKLGERNLQMVCENPYPCEFDRGIVTAIARQFKPQGVILVSVDHDDTKPCRKQDGDSCTYLITW